MALDPQSTRRRFLKALGQGTVAASILGGMAEQASAQEIPRAEGQQMPEVTMPPPQPPSKQLGWAVVGLGKFAVNQILPSFAECRSSRLVALVSGSPDKARKLAQEYGVSEENIYNYQTYDRLRENPQVDVVYIILPNGLHAEYTIRAARAGKHVLCEKPMANTPQDCQAMIDACRKANKKLMIAYRAQYEPYNLEAIRTVQSGELGKLKLVTSDHGRILDLSDPADRWRADKQLAGGGSLFDIGIYSLQATRYITGEEPVEVSAKQFSTPGDPRFREVEETINFTLRFPSGVLANCSSSYGYLDVKRIQVFGDQGNLTLDPATDYYRHRLWITRKQQQGQEVPVLQERYLSEKNQFALEMDHLSESILQNKQPKTAGQEGLQDVRLMLAIYEAARTGRTISV